MGRFRLIPAGAGKTPPRGRVKGVFTAHPRRCGENAASAVESAFEHGSSPQVRGKHSGFCEGKNKVRLIPAGAGKTTGIWQVKHKLAAHPRRCGENISGGTASSL